MKWCFVLWYLQDILQVFGEGHFFAPPLFLVMVLLLMSSERYDHPGLIWFAFLGGVLWDIRWTGLVGMTGGVYAVFATFFSFLWHSMPDTGKNRTVFFTFLMVAHLIIGGLRYILEVSFQDPNQMFFIRQQLLGLPVAYALTRIAFSGEGSYGAS